MNPDRLRTEIRHLPLAQLRHLEVNARYMTAGQQKRLTENIKRDGGLTSLPLVWLMQNETTGTPVADPPAYEIISDNHRVFSAREAGLEEIDCIVILNWISPARRVEMQLAHNAVTGQDDLSVLESLYEQLSLSGKEYSGLSDDLFKGLGDLSLKGFNVDGPAYQELVLTFLPEDAAQFNAMLERAAKAPKSRFHLAHLSDFDRVFDAIVRTKEQLNVQNSAIALSIMASLAAERLDQLAEQEPDEPKEPTDDGHLIEPIE